MYMYAGHVGCHEGPILAEISYIQLCTNHWLKIRKQALAKLIAIASYSMYVASLVIAS